MTDQEWRYYIQRHLSLDGAIPFQSKWRGYNVPDHGERMGALIHRVKFYKGSLPTLYNRYWFLKKWVEDDGATAYRAEIMSLNLVRQSWSGSVKVEFTYKTERWDQTVERWLEI